MAHLQQALFVKECRNEFPEKFQECNVLEIGSWDINGSVRTFFHNCKYKGVDICDGPGVDEVGLGQEISDPSLFYDTIISCECFEHNQYWRETLANMIRMLKPGGICIITCATIGRKEHGTPRTTPTQSLTALELGDPYYKNLTASDFKKTGLLEGLLCYKFGVNIYSNDLYFIGIKTGAPTDAADKVNHLFKKIKHNESGKPTSRLRAFKKKIQFAQMTAIASVVGEKIFHDIHYAKKHAKAELNLFCKKLVAKTLSHKPNSSK